MSVELIDVRSLKDKFESYYLNVNKVFSWIIKTFVSVIICEIQCDIKFKRKKYKISLQQSKVVNNRKEWQMLVERDYGPSESSHGWHL